MTTMHKNSRSLRQRTIELIDKVNLYSDDESLALSNQLFATRVYIILLIISLLFLVTFTGSSIQTRVITISAPSQMTFEGLSIDYPSTLSCPCSQISIPYGQFLTFSPEYHQICTSEFVHPQWISSLFSITTSNYYPLDFRLIAASQFQILALFCRTANEAVSDALKQFASSKMISSNALFRATFDAQIDSLVENLQAITISDTNRIDRFLSLSMAQNRIFSGLRTNFYVKNTPGSNGYVSYSVSYANNFSKINISSSPTDIDDTCYCSDTFDCHFPSGFFNTSIKVVPDSTMWPYPPPVFFVPGMKSGCIPRNTLQKSTLECLFDQSCLNMMSLYMNAFASVTSLNVTRGVSRYNPNTTIGTIFDTLMIESWHKTSNFSGYFHVCAPQLCTYSYARRFSLVYMITTLVSLVGGLNVIIHLLSPILVKFIIQKVPLKFSFRSRNRNDNDEQSVIVNQQKLGIREHFAKYLCEFRHKLITFNLFKKTLIDIRHGIYSTRVYVILLTIAILILSIYLSIIKNTQSITINNPTIEQFEQLYKQYQSTLSCPCEYLSTKYSNIMIIQPRLHQICSSIFIQNDKWLIYWPLDSINQSNTNVPSLFGQDFRITGQTFFNLLQIFCNFASETITNALIVFNSTSFVSSQPLGREQFHAQTSLLLNRFTQTTTESFVLLFDLVYSTIRLNQCLVFGSTNAVPTARQINGTWELRYTSKTYRQGNTTCSCGTSSLCTRAQGFYCQAVSCHSNNALPNMTIPGLNIGCFPVDSILLSTPECFYNQSCIQMLIDWRLFDFAAIYLSVNMNNMTALDSQIPSLFFPNTSLETIISHLFVENWTTDADFIAHYNQCQPKSCTFTSIAQYQAIFVVTSVTGLMGGLTVVLRLLVPTSVKIVRRMCHRRRQQNTDRDSNQSNQLSFFERILQSLQSFNVYERESTEYNHPLLATRIYILLLTISLIIVSIFIGFQQQTYSFTIDLPNKTQFESLHLQYPSTLSCPCSQLAIGYETFLNISPTLHEICFSLFITSNWSISLSKKGDIWTVPDWFLLSAYFRLLSSMCELSKNILDQSISQFISNKLINTETLSFDSFQIQIHLSIESFIEQISTQFHRTLSFILDTCRSNQMIDQYMSTWQVTYSTLDEYFIFRTIPRLRNNNTCLCAAGMLSCSKSLNFLDSMNRTINIPGFVDGCLPMHGLRQSTFECLFDQICLNQLIQLVSFSIPIMALNASRTIRYSPNITLIGSIIDQLFVESWVNSSNYSSYFQQCAPSACRYSYVERNDIVYILTTILGLYGGLTVALRLIVLHGMKVFLLLSARCRLSTKVAPTITIE